MKNIAFSIWMVGYAAVTTYSAHNILPPEDPRAALFVGVANLFIWIFVGRLLYEGKSKS